MGQSLARNPKRIGHHPLLFGFIRKRLFGEGAFQRGSHLCPALPWALLLALLLALPSGRVSAGGSRRRRCSNRVLP
ncbi:MAG TPA: hypothetical protein DEP84_21065, partial [Chloroflexi bacterium]|nr:hypothetical protein [Chloroflexota bacterium]